MEGKPSFSAAIGISAAILREVPAINLGEREEPFGEIERKNRSRLENPLKVLLVLSGGVRKWTDRLRPAAAGRLAVAARSQ